MTENFDWKAIKTNVATWVIISLLGLSVIGLVLNLKNGSSDKNINYEEILKKIDKIERNQESNRKGREKLIDFIDKTNNFNAATAKWFRETVEELNKSLIFVDDVMLDLRELKRDIKELKDK